MSANVRVESRGGYNDEKAFRSMHAAFKRRVNEAGVLNEYSQRQSYESKGQKIRRKRRESEMRRRKEEAILKSKLKERFSEPV